MSDEHQPPPPPSDPPPPPPPSQPPPPPSGGAPPPPPSGGGSSYDSPFGSTGADYNDAQPRFPWEERSDIGFVPAILESAKLLVTDPQEAFSRLRADDDLVSPLLWAVIMGWIGTFFSQIWGLLFQGAMSGMLGGSDMGFLFGGGVLATIFSLIFAPILILIGLFILAGLQHVGLVLVGGLAESDMRFEGTIKVAAYSSIASLTNVIPFLGGFINLVAVIILSAIGLSTVHRTSIGKALVAVLLPIAVCCCLIGVLAAFFGVGAAFLGMAAGG